MTTYLQDQNNSLGSLGNQTKPITVQPLPSSSTQRTDLLNKSLVDFQNIKAEVYQKTQEENPNSLRHSLHDQKLEIYQLQQKIAQKDRLVEEQEKRISMLQRELEYHKK